MTWKVKFSYWNIFSYMCFRLIKGLISFPKKCCPYQIIVNLFEGFFIDVLLGSVGKMQKRKQIDKHSVFFIHADIFNHRKNFNLLSVTLVKESRKLQIVQF